MWTEEESMVAPKDEYTNANMKTAQGASVLLIVYLNMYACNSLYVRGPGPGFSCHYKTS